jgi:hypothetical protein
MMMRARCPSVITTLCKRKKGLNSFVMIVGSVSFEGGVTQTLESYCWLAMVS